MSTPSSDARVSSSPGSSSSAPATPLPPWIPSASALESLPYIQAMSLWNKLPMPDLISKLIDEYKAEQELSRLLKDNRGVPRVLKEFLVNVKGDADRLISKQYRKASLHVHPDRHGDTYQVEFDHLLAAYEALREAELRSEYMQQMLDVVRVIGGEVAGSPLPPPHLMESAHKTWVRDHEVAATKDTAHARYAYTSPPAASKSRPARQQEYTGAFDCYRIEADVFDRAPGVLHIHKYQGLELWIGLQLHDFDSARGSVTHIYVQANPSGEPNDVRKLLSLQGSELSRAFDSAAASKSDVLHVQVTLPEWGYWELMWNVRFQTSATEESRLSPFTHPRSVEVLHPAQVKAMQDKPMLLQVARKETAQLKAMIANNFHNSHATNNKDEVLETRLWKMHHHLGKGQWTSRQLRTCLEVLELVPEQCTELMQLVQVLHDAIVCKTEWDRLLEQSQKRDSLKSFRQSVAAVLERGEAAEWIQTVTKDDLIVNNNNNSTGGGEVNRLFQLLVEGCKTKASNTHGTSTWGSLFVDSVTLERAAERTDLFSEKQCQMLRERGNQVHKQMLQEQDREFRQQCKLERDEQLRRDMERMAQLLPRHTLVQLVNLQNRSELNEQLGYFMGVQGDRYVIQLAGSHKEVALKEENFVRWKPDSSAFTSYHEEKENQNVTTDGSGRVVDVEPPPQPMKQWACLQCSYLNSGSSTCDMCGAGEPEKVDSNDDDYDLLCDGDAWKAAAEAAAPVASGTAATSVSVSPTSSTDRTSADVVSTKHVKIADQCKKPVATIYMKKGDISFFIGCGGANVKRLQQTARVTNINVSKDDIQDGLVPVRIEGRPHCVQKAVQMTESAYEVVLKSPAKKGPAPSKHRHYQQQQSHHSSICEARADLSSPSSFASSAGTSGHQVQSHPPTRLPNVQKPVAVRSIVHAAPAASTSKAPRSKNLNTKPAALSPAPGKQPAAFCALEKAASAPPAPLSQSLVKESPSRADELLDFCQQEAACIKGSPKSFCEWLRAEDVDTLQALAEAMEDEDFRSEMQAKGLKGFKKAAFKKAVSAAAATTKSAHIESSNCKLDAGIPVVQNGLHHHHSHEVDGPHELYCPISFVLMVDDPVVACDHYTYERRAIESWFERHDGVETIRSPMTDEILTSLALIPNIVLRNMARTYYNAQSHSSSGLGCGGI